MAFIYSLTDSWNDVTTTWNGIKLAVTNTSSDASSKLLNLTVSGATTASFVVDKSGNLELNGSVNKVTITAPATAATFTLANNSTFATVGAHSATFTFTGTTAVTFPTSGTVTALGNSSTGSGDIVLATSPTLVTPNLGTPSAVTLTNGTGLPVSTGISGLGTGVAAALAANVGSSGAFVTFGGALGTPSSGNLSNCTGFSVSNIGGLGSGVATWLGTPSSANLAAAVTDETGSGSLVFATSPSLVTPDLGTPSAATLTNATGLPISTGVSGLGANVATFLATPSSANLRAAVTDETGTGSLVFSNSPTFNDDITLGVASTATGSAKFVGTTSGIVTLSVADTAGTWTMKLPTTAGTNGYYLQTDGLGNTTWAAGGGGGGGSPGGSNTQVQFNDSGSFGGDTGFTYDKTADAVTIGVASTSTGALKLASASSANVVTVQSGNNSAAWSLTLPTSAGTNGYLLQTDGSGATSWVTPPATGLTVGSTAISGGTSGRILYDNAGALGEKAVTGTGDVVLATSPTLVTPTLGVAAATSINKVAITAPATGSTLTIADGKTLTASNTLTFTGTDSSSVAFGAGGTVLYNGGALGTPSSGTLTSCTGLPISTGVSGLGSNVATFLATPSSANLAAAVTDETGSGALVFGTSPTFTTSALFPAGSVSAPGIAASGDTDTGIYFPAANQVALATNGTAALTVDSSQNVSVTGTLAMGSSFLRNRIINGDMRIDQRASGASSTVTGGSGYFSCDRWQEWMSVSSKYSIQRSTTAPTGFINSLLATSLSAYSVLSTDSYAISQQIEGVNISDLAWGSANAKTITVSFWVQSSLTGTFGGAVSNSAVNRSYPFTYSISAANTWEQKTITIAGDTTGTWLTDTGIGIRLWFSIGAGSSYLGTAGTWAAADYRGASGQTSVVGTNGATFYITGVQLEVGSVATPFERRQYGTELMLCQRYYVKFGGNRYPGASNGTTSVAYPVPLPVTMRATPSVTATVPQMYSYDATLVNISSITYSVNASYDNSISFQTGGLSVTDNTVYWCTITSGTLSAEL